MNTAFLREIDREAEQSGDVLSILIQRLDRPTPLYSLRPDSVWVSASLLG